MNKKYNIVYADPPWSYNSRRSNYKETEGWDVFGNEVENSNNELNFLL